MNLISCNTCGVVVDKSKLAFPEDIWKEDGCIDDEKGIYDDNVERFVAFVDCPVCSCSILESQ